MLNITLKHLNNVGISASPERTMFYNGMFFPKVHSLVEAEFGNLLAEGEHFQISSHFLLTVLGKAGDPTIPTDALLTIICQCVALEINQAS